MRKKLNLLILGLVMFLLTIFAGGTVRAQAADLTSQLSGLTADAATTTIAEDGVTTPIANSDTLEAGQNYTIVYNWRIPDGLKVHDGDTATVTLPLTSAGGSASFAIVNQSTGKGIGQFTLDQTKSQNGTITFNGVDNTAVNRQGQITVNVTGKSSGGSGTEHGDFVIGKNGWVSGQTVKKIDGENVKVPTQVTWDIVFNPNDENYGATTITDTLGANQSFDEGSVKMVSPANEELPKTIVSPMTGDGQRVTFDFGNSQHKVEFTYTTTVTNLPNISHGSFTNTASLISDHGASGTSEIGNGAGTETNPAIAHKVVKWGGNGNYDGDNLSLVLTKHAADTNAPLPGAEYELLDNQGKVAKTGTTDENGKITFSKLPAGTYYYVETKNPTGYQLDPQPYRVEVQAIKGQTTTGVEVVDQLAPSDSSSGDSSGASIPIVPDSSTPTVPENPSDSNSSSNSDHSSSSSNSSSSNDSSGTSTASSTPVNDGGFGGNGDGDSSTPTSSAKRTTGGGAATTPQTRSHGKQAVSRLPQTSDQKLAGAMLIGFLLLGGALSYTAWRRNRD
ncbi:hypothetical protein LZY01_10030 [Levilactobacillus zymae]|uniref:LPXTG cell wall anchor domain-containing protein n=1 Tax=Levilactobacillus zymae TaxID=267363 RepID=A0ABQ0WVE2_9LACO|nr:SpaA isopeptide-forming pilin-related protein [Levilactobacillus zymae]KRL07372.1 hypothetical protein FD38_GL000287 [Levilactobacillus zymae DSM 19395]QFR60484.1 LPXTG cell wall anchor domain-containing protein [Levilactobacillus zymae]GEO71835.1 hypothetical protein LZY01_10030 [Levilactobacillus zymae]